MNNELLNLENVALKIMSEPATYVTKLNSSRMTESLLIAFSEFFGNSDLESTQSIANGGRAEMIYNEGL